MLAGCTPLYEVRTTGHYRDEPQFSIHSQLEQSIVKRQLLELLRFLEQEDLELLQLLRVFPREIVRLA